MENYYRSLHEESDPSLVEAQNEIDKDLGEFCKNGGLITNTGKIIASREDCLASELEYGVSPDFDSRLRFREINGQLVFRQATHSNVDDESYEEIPWGMKRGFDKYAQRILTSHGVASTNGAQEVNRLFKTLGKEVPSKMKPPKDLPVIKRTVPPDFKHFT